MEPIKINWGIPSTPTCQVVIYGPDVDVWERELFEKKQSELSPSEFSAWVDGYNYHKFSIDISEFKPPYGIAKFGVENNKTILLNSKILGFDWKSTNILDNKYQWRQNIVYIQASSGINLGSGIFSGWCVLKETRNLDGSYYSYSYHTKLRGDQSKLNIENLCN